MEMDYETVHKYIKQMVSRGDLGIVIDDNQIVLQVKDLKVEDEELGLSATKGFEGVYTSEITNQETYSENRI